jgi:hypothetical protein
MFLLVLVFAFVATASAQRIHYSGSHNTYSHGGHYAGRRGSSHKGDTTNLEVPTITMDAISVNVEREYYFCYILRTNKERYLSYCSWKCLAFSISLI